MSILIPGMEMPCEGLMTIIAIGYDGRVFQPIEYPDEHTLYHETKYIAIELPPHGRLIDADALKVYQMEENVRSDGDPNEYEYDAGLIDGLHMAAKDVRVAPTVIPADPEGGADNG